jgi:7,8-dihydropterin-6-yl-methyl-4-(beta-D-ribofuranosyl)aminobenzene 5'-phosphate synthase
MTIECFAVVVVGGLGSLGGAILGGLINTMKHAQKMTGIEKVYMVIGGFHLSGSSPERIQKIIADIKAINPEHIVLTHCTGFQAISAFAREIPDRFILNTAGTKYTITG